MTNEDDLYVSFAEFAWIWNRMEGFDLPRHQRRMAGWLENCWKSKKRQGLLMAFRNSGKSTLVGLFCAWSLFQRPECRILVVAADHSLAKKMVRNVKRIIEKHPLTTSLLPSQKSEWASDRFTIKRDIELRDPSMLAKGLGANVTGLRADIIICDDVEVPKTCDTAVKRKELRDKLHELDYVLVPDGMQLYIGTPHNFETIYQTEKAMSIDSEKPHCEGFKKLEIPIVNRFGKSAWPDRFSLEKIEAIKKRTGPNKFKSQMMLQPVRISDSRLNPDMMQVYKHELKMTCSNGHDRLLLGDTYLVSATAFWDPAFGVSTKGDNSVIAAMFFDNDGNCFLHSINYLRVPEKIDVDPATWQCRQVALFAKEWHLPAIRVETNGLGQFLPALLRREMAEMNIASSVIEHRSKKSKDLRILEAYDAVLAAKALHINKTVLDTNFVNEMRDWLPGIDRGHDDGLDAVAGCLLAEPIRLKRSFSLAKKSNWQMGANSYEASTDFDV